MHVSLYIWGCFRGDTLYIIKLVNSSLKKPHGNQRYSNYQCHRCSVLLWIFQVPTFLFLNRVLCCHHSLESSRRDVSNEWSQHRIQLGFKEILLKMLTILILIQSTLDISNLDISNSAKLEASIWINNTFWLLSPTIIWRRRLLYKSKLPEVQINLHFG